MEDKLNDIIGVLAGKAALKQAIYQATHTIFGHLRDTAAATMQALQQHFKGSQPPVELDFDEVGEHEFRIRCASDVLIFQMQTDVQTFGHEHLIHKSPYIQQDASRSFFGCIVVYNFLADSVRYNRLTDAGYLLARILLNHEGHFYIEGLRQLNFLHPDIASNVVSGELLLDFVQTIILEAIDTDLVAPPFQEVQIVALGDKLQDQLAGAAKVGFQMQHKG